MSVIWNLLGTERLGNVTNGRFGQKIALSANGNVLAVGAPFETTTSSANGIVRIYEFNGTDWDPIGSIEGQNSGERIGSVISLSANGSRIALGLPLVDKMRVYDRSGSTWNLNTELTGPSQLIPSEFGTSVSLSNDGTVLVVGAPKEGSNPQNPSGAIRIYRNDGQNWGEPQIVNGLEGSSEYGTAVAISGDKNFIAIGAPFAGAGGTDRGSVHILKFSISFDDWRTLTFIDGEADNDRSGSSLSISNNGMRIVVGATLHNGNEGLDTGYIRIGELDVETYPIMPGGRIEGMVSEHLFGSDVAISGDGNTVVASSSPAEGGNYIRTFHWDDGMSMWFEISDLLVGDTLDSEFGKSIALSNTGTRLGVGIPFGGDVLGMPDLGEARVYNRLGDVITVPTTTIPPTTMSLSEPTTTMPSGGGGPLPPPPPTTINNQQTTTTTNSEPTTTDAQTTNVPDTTMSDKLTPEEVMAIINYWLKLILSR